MTASIQESRNKYFIVLSWKENGKRKQKWVGTDLSTTGNNKRKVERMRTEILAEWEVKLQLNGNGILFADYLKEWLETCKHSIAENTYYAYKQTIYNSICPYFHAKHIKLSDLKAEHLQSFYNMKLDKDKVTANTVHHYHANIHKALKHAVKTERIASNPADKVILPKKEKHIADYYTAEELKLLLARAKGTDIEVVVLLASWFGLRRGEIIGLKWNCIDFDNCTLSIVGTMTDKGENGSKTQNLTYRPTAKTKASLRTFPLRAEQVSYLRQLKQEQDERKKHQYKYKHEWDEFVCVRKDGSILSLEYVTVAFPKLCKQCGLRRIKLHELRHTNISLLVQNGASIKEVQEWAGHSNFSTTADIYTHIQSQNKLKLAESLASVIG